ncbi:MAG: STAS domain-containing protein [Pseudomonadota bacterium]
MNHAAIREASPGLLQLGGVLDYRSGPELRTLGAYLIKASSAQALVLDCAAVKKSSSVGLSLLLAFMRDAKAQHKTLTLRALPKDMQQIAQVCGLTALLPLES